MNLGISLVVLLVIVLVFIVFMYNSFVRSRNRVREAWADIEVQLKRRHNLIPNLVNSVQGYVKHEKGVLEAVTKTRAQALQATGREDVEKGENMLSDALKTLFAVSENYPDLKASQNFIKLQDELSDTENKIQAARRFFNTNVRDFNTTLESFPQNLFAGIFGFKKEEMFKIEIEEEREVPNVKF